MSFFAVLLALVIEQLKPLPRGNWVFGSLVAWMRDGRSAILFVAGESHACSLRFARAVCVQTNFPLATVCTQTAASIASDRDRVTLRALIDAGHLVLVRRRLQRRV